MNPATLQIAAQHTPERSLTAALQLALQAPEHEPHWQLYALIDPLLGDIDETVWDPVEITSKVRLLVRSPELSTEQTPYLVGPLKALEHSLCRFVQTFVEQAITECWQPRNDARSYPRRWSALLHTPMSQEELCDVLGHAARVMDARGKRQVLRFWDPRIIQHMHADDEQARKFAAGFLGRWGYAQCTGQWRWFDCSQHAPQREPSLRHLNEAEQAAMMEWSQWNALHETIDGARTLAGMSFDARWKWLRECLHAARSLGLDAPEDQLSFAARRCQYRAPLERSARLRESIGVLRTEGLSYACVEAELAEEDWQQMSDEVCNQTIHREK